jgi:hypothetical protein
LKIKIADAPDSEFSHFRELSVSAGNELNSYLFAAMFALCADERLKTGHPEPVLQRPTFKSQPNSRCRNRIDKLRNCPQLNGAATGH